MERPKYTTAKEFASKSAKRREKQLLDIEWKFLHPI